MSKLFKLKEWLTIPEAAKYLSVVFGEEIFEADVYRLALDKKIALSIYFTKLVKLKRVEIVPIPLEIKPYITHGDSMTITQADEIIYLDGIFDLLLLDLNWLLIEEKCNYSIADENKEFSALGSIYLEQNNQLFELQEELDRVRVTGFEEMESMEQFLKKYADEYFFPAQSLPKHGLLIVRTDALRELEELMSSSVKNDAQKSKESTRKIENLLCALTSVAIDAYGYDPNSAKSSVPQDLADAMSAQGIDFNARTVRNWLKEGVDLLPSKTKKD